VSGEPVTNDRDSSGGYLTGDESERLWDEEEEDAFASAQLDGDDGGDDSYPSLELPIESIWARAFVVAAEIVANDQAIDRVQSLTTFDPNDLAIEELDARSDALADERFELEYQMRIRGFPPKRWSPQPAALPQLAAGPSRHVPSRRSLSPGEILRPHLTDGEFQHWEWLDQGVIQVEVARRLGITQVAVSKREKKLRARIDVIYIGRTGRPYHWTPIPKAQGGRRRKR